ncbi:tyrosine--tRNA ligase [Photobacterium sanguinicancri]|uniref:Tyrosine--tRNA ligase n=1 Tax=Photobacterium sanguinicancri TaxID=875932 RepID=A0AAW7Y279_9GAMM|nr:tyrosine--tRNA ligase [Photobacterium sanguinicancri]MDO6541841.1 tyrosine--tRNA ligase [Photobacterium sanguinicancri]
MSTINQDLFNELQQRGLIAQASNSDELQQHLAESRTVYCGFDPTAGSLHIGHLVPLVMLRRFQLAGHSAVALVGGATGMIGDPSFKANERTLNNEQTVKQWVADLRGQIQHVLHSEQSDTATILNNADWISGMNIISFFRDIGKHFSVNAMINKESVKQRLNRPEQGISFTEFSYSLLQSYDFAHLNQEHDCSLQIGGNDQWGNITSGIDLTRRLNQQKVFGLTLPLITKSDGTKFGKTESGAVWLDSTKTSPYSFYQFWLNSADADVYNFLRYYTFLSVEAIADIEHQDSIRNGKPQAQQILAEALTTLVHGEDALLSAQRISLALFSGELQSLTLAELQQLELDGLPCSTLDTTLSLPAILVKSGLASSNRQAREFMANQAISVNGETAISDDLSTYLPLQQQYLVLRRGKKQFHLLNIEKSINNSH